MAIYVAVITANHRTNTQIIEEIDNNPNLYGWSVREFHGTVTEARDFVDEAFSGPTERQAEAEASSGTVDFALFANDKVYRNAWTAKVNEIGRG